MKQPNHLALSLVCWALLPLAGLTQQDTLDMDVTFGASATMEVRDAVKLSSWPMARPLSSEKPIEPRPAFEAASIRAHHDPRGGHAPEGGRVPLPPLQRPRRAGGGSRARACDASYTDFRSREGSWGTSLHHASTSSLRPTCFLAGSRKHVRRVELALCRAGKVSFNAQVGQHKTRMFGFDSTFVDSISVDATALRWRHAGAALQLKSHRKDSTAFNHEFNTAFDYMTNNHGLAERHVLGELNLHRHVGGKRLDIGVEAQLTARNWTPRAPTTRPSCS